MFIEPVFSMAIAFGSTGQSMTGLTFPKNGKPAEIFFEASSIRKLASNSAFLSLIPASNKLNALLDNQNTNGYVFKPTLQAYNNACARLLLAYKLMGRSYFEPSILPDGEGGIDIEWEKDSKHLLLSCQATSGQRDFLYYQQDDKYEAKDFSVSLLKEKLYWLIRNAR